MNIPDSTNSKIVLKLINSGITFSALKGCLLMASKKQEWTQDQICKALRINQANLSKSINDLHHFGFVSKRRIKTHTQRHWLNLYSLTA